MHHPFHTLTYCLMCACLAITYRRYLIQEGGLLWFVPSLVYKVLPTDYATWNPLQKAFEKITVVCATCQAGQLAFWLSFATGSGWIDCFLYAGCAAVMAHMLDEKYFAK